MPALPVLAALLFCGLSVVVVGFQIALIAGARWGHLTMGGRHPGALDRTGRVLAMVSALLYIPLVLAVLSAVGLGPNLPHWTVWPVVAVMTLSTVGNAITHSAPERRLWLPIVSTMLACTLVVAVMGGGTPDQVSSSSSSSPLQPAALARSIAAS